MVLYLGRDATGKEHHKWHSVRGTRRDAQRELARLLHEKNTGSYVEPARMTVGEFLDRWLADYAKPKVSPKTCERYREIIDGHIRPALGSYLLPKLAPLHIQALYSDALAKGRKDGKGGLSAQSVIHFHRLPPDMFSTTFAAFVRRSSLRSFRFHDLRHSHASRLLRAGVYPKIVSERLGHSTVGITLDPYSHVLPGMQEDAVRLLDAALAMAMQKNAGEKA